MPTVLQSALLSAVILALTLFWSAFAFLLTLLDWWRNRGSYFVVQKHPRPAVLDNPKWKHRFIKLTNVQLHYVEMEEEKESEGKPLMLFVHGFPEFWYSWRHQLDHFSRKYRTVAVDLRGYNDSDKPAGVSSYNLELLTNDVAELIERLGGKAVLVGHDWGGIISWAVAIERPELVHRLIVMNAPHPKAAAKAMRTRSSQLLKSWYIFFFQCPWLPEIRLWARDYAFIESCFRSKRMGLVHAENFTDEDAEAWKHVFSKPNALSPPLNYYRASMRAVHRQHFPYEPVKPKTLIVWGEQDAALTEVGAHLSVGMCREVRLEKIADASHWVQQDVPQKVNALVESWLAE